MTALIGGHRLAIEWLLKQQDIAINTVNNATCSALHIASGSSSCDGAVIHLLLANGADIHKCTHKQQTALDVAASYGNLECAKALIAAGADVNHADSEGHATLHTALCRKMLK
jgi:ankyrin repeat protein